jgi:protein-glutamine gamma-glutamyltransferase
MKTPPLLLGGSILFWGWQVGNLPIAAIMAIVVELAHVLEWRWESLPRDFDRILRICVLLSLGLVIYVYFAHGTEHPILRGTGWIPVGLFPLIVGQEYSSEGRFVSTFTWAPRIKRQISVVPRTVAVNLAPLYVVVCFAAASTANVRSFAFYAGMSGFAAWTLFLVRSRKVSLALWGTLFALASVTGYVGQIGLNRLQGIVERKVGDWLVDYFEDTDPYRTHTALGEIGKLKLSDRIVLRVEPEVDGRHPVLLHEASYNRVSGSSWVAWESALKNLAPGKTTNVWTLYDKPRSSRAVTISTYLTRGKGVLPLPQGSFSIEQLPASVVKNNRLGTVKVEGCPAMVKYQVRYDPENPPDAPPAVIDLEIPTAEVPMLERVITQEGLAGLPPEEAGNRLKAMFQRDFHYSLYQSSSTGAGSSKSKSYLERFLLDTHSGHCEYFATATVLLLRQMKVPARYATGYSVQEFSKLENLFVVRARHAHAWARAYLDGRWQDLDTTPAIWSTIEQEQAPWWQGLYDLCSQGIFLFSTWRMHGKSDVVWTHLGWVLVPLIALLAWRLIFRRSKGPSSNKAGGNHGTLVRSGEDSEFNLIVKLLTEWGYPPLPGETLSDWLSRLEASPILPHEVTAPLRNLLTLHYKYRFDPRGIPAQQRAALKEGTFTWLSQSRKETMGHPKPSIGLIAPGR